MFRARVQCHFVSLDGYSAGDFVTFDKPIGDAQSLFGWFDGRGIEGMQQTKEAAKSLDVRIGGGPSTVRQFLADDLVDFMHVAIVPITLGHGTSLWEGVGGVEDRFSIETIGTASGLTHQLWNRKDRARSS